MKKIRLLKANWSLWLLILLSACAYNPYAVTNKSYKKQVKAFARQLKISPIKHKSEAGWIPGDYWVGTINFNMRKPNYVVIHHTAQDSTIQTLKTFTIAKTQVSAHYVIGRDGKIYHMLNDYLRAWHGGVSKWGNNTDLNSSSIGIELDNNGLEPFSEAQINSLLVVLAKLKSTYNIPAANFIGHSDIAPTRKNDPNTYFPWKRLAEQGYGLWYDEILPDTLASLDTTLVQDSLQSFMKPEFALKIIGYDTRNLPAAIKAFKIHFIQKDIDTTLTLQDKKILFNLYPKYME